MLVGRLGVLGPKDTDGDGAKWGRHFSWFWVSLLLLSSLSLISIYIYIYIYILYTCRLCESLHKRVKKKLPGDWQSRPLVRELGATYLGL